MPETPPRRDNAFIQRLTNQGMGERDPLTICGRLNEMRAYRLLDGIDDSFFRPLRDGGQQRQRNLLADHRRDG
jgi:hypothetical protein